MAEKKEFLKETDVAELTSIPIRTLQNERYQRRGIPFIKKNRSIFYKRQDVLNFLEQYKIQTAN